MCQLFSLFSKAFMLFPVSWAIQVTSTTSWQSRIFQFSVASLHLDWLVSLSGDVDNKFYPNFAVTWYTNDKNFNNKWQIHFDEYVVQCSLLLSLIFYLLMLIIIWYFLSRNLDKIGSLDLKSKFLLMLRIIFDCVSRMAFLSAFMYSKEGNCFRWNWILVGW